MSAAIDQLLRLNQCPLSWTSTRSLISGLPVVGITEVNIEESREGELVHGQQPDGTPLGITSGLYKVDSFSFKCLSDTAEQVLQTIALSVGLTGLAAGSYGDARFTYQLVLSEPLGPTMTISVSGVKIEKRKKSFQKGTGALEDEFECKAMSVRTVGAALGLTGIPNQLWSLQRSLV